MEEGVSLFLYRVEINAGLRNMPVQTGLTALSAVRLCRSICIIF